MKNQMKFKYLIFISTLSLCLARAIDFNKSLISPAYAQHFSSPSYYIDWGNFNITSGRKASTNYQLTDTVGQNAPGTYEKNGLKIKSGFQYIYDTFNQLSFSIDKLNIEFGTIAPGIASTDTNILTITTPSGHGYQVTAQENHPLWINSSLFIPNTSCDLNDCTHTFSTAWTSTTEYGFGFNASGVGASSYFSDSSFYRPFSDISNNEDPAIILSENSPVKDRTATINYKVIISPLQAAGDYQNYITYTLVPRY